MARTTSTTTTPAGGTGPSTGNKLDKRFWIYVLAFVLGTVSGAVIDQAFFAEP